MLVPTAGQVIPGKSVQIVLKADQPTGRTVCGTIKDVLTRGNHPRGIKVRLDDGRVGRVQSMLTGSVARQNGGGPVEINDSVPDTHQCSASRRHGHDGARAHGFQTDARFDQDAPIEALALDAYIKPAKQTKSRGKATSKMPIEASESAAFGMHSAGDATAGGAGGSVSENLKSVDSETPVCPVCGLPGDEAAVTFHVATHFD